MKPDASESPAQILDCLVASRGIAADVEGADRGRKICRDLAGRVVVGRQHDRCAVDIFEEAKRERFVGNPVLKAEYRLLQHSGGLEPHQCAGRVRTLHRQKDDIVSLEGDFLGIGADGKLRRPRGLRGEKCQPRASHGFELPAAGNADDRVPGKAQLGSNDSTDCAQPVDDDPHPTHPLWPEGIHGQHMSDGVPMRHFR